MAQHQMITLFLVLLFSLACGSPVGFPFYIPRGDKRAINPFVDTIGKRSASPQYVYNRHGFFSHEDMDRLGRYLPRRLRHSGFDKVEDSDELWRE